MKKITYKNRFGTLVLTPMTPYMAVSTISFDKCQEVQDNTISLECAEKVALISDNRQLQVCLPMQLQFNAGYVIHHQGASSACVCKVDIESFTSDFGMSPSQQIAYEKVNYALINHH